jgi:hypothetical protein
LYRVISTPLVDDEVVGVESFYGVKNSKHKVAIKFKNQFEIIRKKYQCLFPQIFDDVNYENLQIDAYEITVLLMKLYKNDHWWRLGDNLARDNAYFEEFQSLLKLEQIRQEFFFRKVYDQIENLGILDEKIDLLLENFKKNPKMNQGTKLYVQQTLYVLDYHDLVNDTIPSFFYSIFSKAIQNRIIFDFYLIYKAYCRGWKAVDLDKSQIRKDHDVEITKLLEFSKEYVDNMKSHVGKEYR